MPFTYTVGYDPLSGRPVCVNRSDGAMLPLNSGSMDWNAFLTWNAAQTPPLDYTTATAPSQTAVATQERAATISNNNLKWGLIPPEQMAKNNDLLDLERRFRLLYQHWLILGLPVPPGLDGEVQQAMTQT